MGYEFWPDHAATLSLGSNHFSCVVCFVELMYCGSLCVNLCFMQFKHLLSSVHYFRTSDCLVSICNGLSSFLI